MCFSSVLEKHVKFSEPCTAGKYLTASGCQQCKEDTYSGAGAYECTSCPGGKVSAAGSTSESACKDGR